MPQNFVAKDVTPVKYDSKAPCPILGKVCPQDPAQCRFWTIMPYPSKGILTVQIIDVADCILFHTALQIFGVNNMLNFMMAAGPGPTIPPGMGRG